MSLFAIVGHFYRICNVSPTCSLSPGDACGMLCSKRAMPGHAKAGCLNATNAPHSTDVYAPVFDCVFVTLRCRTALQGYSAAPT